ncbi:MAG: hypothetical protein ACTSUF_03790 [Candidatus Heimdallarchaeaceae archaeon]
MKYKKFILWLFLFFGYIGFLHLFSTPVETSASGMVKEGISRGSVVVPGMSNLVTVQIIRAPREYWLGIIKAPAYVFGMNIDFLNRLVIDYAMPLLLLIFIIWEFIVRFRKGGTNSSLAFPMASGGSQFLYLKKLEKMGLAKKEGKNMNKSVFMSKSLLKVLTRGLGIGILLAFFAFILGDSPTIAVLLLVIYMEIRFRKKEKYI